MIELTKKLVSLAFVFVFLLSLMVVVRAQSVHDVAVVSVTVTLPYRAEACYPGWGAYHEKWRQIRITVVVENQGTETESFTVTTYYDNHTIQDYYGNHTQSVINLAPGANATLTFAWNTKSVNPCPYNYSIPIEGYIPYNISANASLINDNNPTNNYLIDGTLVVRKLGDANGDGKVNGGDLGWVGWCWYRIYPYPCYDWRADFTGDGSVKGDDIGILGWYWYTDC